MPIFFNPSFACLSLIVFILVGCGVDIERVEDATPGSENTEDTEDLLDSVPLSMSVSGLALQVDGNPRKITITNTGEGKAAAVGYTIDPALPAGSIISPLSCGDLEPAESCELTVTPGGAVIGEAGEEALPSVLSVSGSNTLTASTNILILDYGSIYQGGYVFAIDDTTPDAGSIGGKVVDLQDQAPPFPNGVVWSVDGTAVNGINESSTAGAGSCDGNLDGSCNTDRIIGAFLGASAAESCFNANSSGFADWYLPAICELGHDDANQGSGCGTAAAPLTQNIQSNLVENGDIGEFAGSYWSSTEFSGDPADRAWLHDFTGATTVDADKNILGGVRCVRALSY